jgi:hypothetical protein
MEIMVCIEKTRAALAHQRAQAAPMRGMDKR